MQCNICRRDWSSKLPFNCTICARNTLYETRIEQAQTLLQRETAGNDVIGFVGAPGSVTTTTKLSGQEAARNNKTFELERASSAKTDSLERTHAILNHKDALHKELEASRELIARRRTLLSQRRSDYDSATHSLSQRRAAALEPVESSIKRTQGREAANLYGLQQRKRRKGMLGRDSYTIGGVPIVDLRDLNNAIPAQVTTSLGSLAHLVHLVSHYLSVRLPAEITLPHRDYPLATIFSPGSSYLSRDVPFPGSTPSPSSNNSPSASRAGDVRPLPRPRPLYLEKKLPVLAKEDVVAYSHFVEGVTLLAWDIAWVCKTQGLNVGASSWEEVCAMGKNLWQLLIAPPPKLPLPRITSSDVPTKSSATKNPPTLPTASNEVKPNPMLGHYSHGTAHSFLASAEGAELMRGWRLQSPVKLIERVKAALLSERTGAEWEMLEENEWEEEEPVAPTKDPDPKPVDEEAVLVRGKRKEDGSRYDDTRSFIAAITVAGSDTMATSLGADEGGDKTKGASGWTKLKSRAGA
ncbi:UV radiation resistance protein/autophagy-related protein 14 [Lasallia pustulata]|uniref:Autophagy-related protein 14 n=1 Tax=Lasallia pustulata TaxID=136370 RepID=A0A1W5CT88_9LECA|nr:UV radiation resistance protein/autophagy-related protein 14 [Lasallia pustulata]